MEVHVKIYCQKNKTHFACNFNIYTAFTVAAPSSTVGELQMRLLQPVYRCQKQCNIHIYCQIKNQSACNVSKAFNTRCGSARKMAMRLQIVSFVS